MLDWYGERRYFFLQRRSRLRTSICSEWIKIRRFFSFYLNKWRSFIEYFSSFCLSLLSSPKESRKTWLEKRTFKCIRKQHDNLFIKISRITLKILKVLEMMNLFGKKINKILLLLKMWIKKLKVKNKRKKNL